MTRFALPLALLLAACAASQPREPAMPAMDHAECRTEALAAADVREIGRRANPDNPELMARLREELRDAQWNAYRRCLRARGLPSPGGVERVRAPS
ncbi:MAG: phosphoribosylamine--glycine ligase [Roseococcus sp.]|nr:phosphoribosylamine--glycine ligase [Roseococcus sp.]